MQGVAWKQAAVRSAVYAFGSAKDPRRKYVCTRLAACDGEDALAGILNKSKAATPATDKPTATKGTGAYLTSLTVEGFRGIGPRQTLTLTPGPGLTIVVGRDGSGKSSFAEALEVLLAGDSKRRMDRSKIWKEG